MNNETVGNTLDGLLDRGCFMRVMRGTKTGDISRQNDDGHPGCATLISRQDARQNGVGKPRESKRR